MVRTVVGFIVATMFLVSFAEAQTGQQGTGSQRETGSNPKSYDKTSTSEKTERLGKEQPVGMPKESSPTNTPDPKPRSGGKNCRQYGASMVCD